MEAPPVFSPIIPTLSQAWRIENIGLGGTPNYVLIFQALEQYSASYIRVDKIGPKKKLTERTIVFNYGGSRFTTTYSRYGKVTGLFKRDIKAIYADPSIPNKEPVVRELVLSRMIAIAVEFSKYRDCLAKMEVSDPKILNAFIHVTRKINFQNVSVEDENSSHRETWTTATFLRLKNTSRSQYDIRHQNWQIEATCKRVHAAISVNNKVPRPIVIIKPLALEYDQTPIWNADVALMKRLMEAKKEGKIDLEGIFVPDEIVDKNKPRGIMPVWHKVTGKFLMGLLEENQDTRKSDLRTKLKWVYQIAKGLNTLQKHFNVAHHDLKTDNILFDGENVYIIDFGYSVSLDDPDLCNKGTRGFAGPEVWRNNARYHRVYDSVALGVIIVKIVTNNFVAAARVQAAEIFRVVDVFAAFSAINRLTPPPMQTLAGIVHQLLQADPTKRLSITDAFPLIESIYRDPNPQTRIGNLNVFC